MKKYFDSLKNKLNILGVTTSLLAGIYTALVYVLGKEYDGVIRTVTSKSVLAVRMVLIAAATTILSFLVWPLFDLLREKYNQRQKKKPAEMTVGLMMTVMIVMWIPSLLAIWPGAYSYDAYDEWVMMATGNISAHHPLWHVLMSGGLVEISYKIFGSYNAGIAIYSIAQMLLLALCFALIIRFLREKGAGLPLQIGVLAYYSLHPVIALFSNCATKDVLFSGAEVLFFLYIWDMLENIDRFLAARSKVIPLIAVSLLTAFGKNNGIYIVAATYVLLLAVVLSSKARKKIGIFLIVFCISIFTKPIIEIPVNSMFDIASDENASALSVPIMQMARVYVYEEENLDQSEREAFLEFVPQEAMSNYKESVADNIKSNLDEEYFENHKKEFWNLWLTWGKKYPGIYVTSFVLQTVDGWYPGAVIDGYRFPDAGSYFDYKVAKPGEAKPILKSLNKIYTSIAKDESLQQKGLWFVFFSPGWYLLIFVWLWLYQISCREFSKAGAGITQLIHYGTVLLGPIALVRYELNFFYILPVIVCMMFLGTGSKKDKSRR